MLADIHYLNEFLSIEEDLSRVGALPFFEYQYYLI
jgi:hypothetical protein